MTRRRGGLSTSQKIYDVLVKSRAGWLAVAAISERIDVGTTTVSSTLRAMEKHGIVEMRKGISTYGEWRLKKEVDGPLSIGKEKYVPKAATIGVVQGAIASSLNPLTCAEIAKRTGIGLGTVQEVVRILFDKKRVVKVPLSEDGRRFGYSSEVGHDAST